MILIKLISIWCMCVCVAFCAVIGVDDDILQQTTLHNTNSLETRTQIVTVTTQPEAELSSVETETKSDIVTVKNVSEDGLTIADSVTNVTSVDINTKVLKTQLETERQTQKEIQVMKQEFQELKNFVEQTLKSVLTNHISDQHQILSEMRTNVSKVQNESNAVKKTTDELETEIIRLRGKTGDLKSELNNVKTGKLPSPDPQIQANVEDLMQSLSSQSTAITMMDNKFAGDIAELVRTQSSVWRKLGNLKSTVAGLTTGLSSVQENVSSLVQNVSFLEHQISSVNDKVSYVEQKVLSVEQNVSTTKEQVSSVAKHISSTDQQVSSVKRKVSSVELKLSSTEQKVLSTDEKVSFVEKKVSSTEQRVSSVENGVSAVEQKVSSTGEKVSSTEKRVSSVEQGVSSVEKHVSSVEQKVSNTEQKVLTVEEDVSSVEQHVSFVEQDVSSVKQTVSSVQQQVSTVEKKVTAVEEDVSLTDKEVTSVKRKVSSTDQRVSSVQQKVSTVEQKVSSTEQEISEVDQTVQSIMAKQVQVAFTARTGQDIYRSNQAIHVIKFDQVLHNTGNDYDSSTGHFTAPVSGLYHFAVTAKSISDNLIDLRFYHSNDISRYCMYGSGQATCVWDVHLSSGGLAYVRFYAGDGIMGMRSYFSGHLVLPD